MTAPKGGRRPKKKGAGNSAPPAGTAARKLAIEAVRRIADEGAFANLLVPSMLADSTLDQRDRNLVTEMAYGATRMRRAVDWLVDRFLVSPPPPALRASLRVGAYQLAFMRIPPHAAVSATVEATAKRNRGVVNAILRKVAAAQPIEWPSAGVRLSYPDWLIARLVDDLGHDEAMAMLELMNTAPSVTERDDGYVQDRASQWVVDLVAAQPSDVVLDMCAAPGGKSTALARDARVVVASDMRPFRSGLVAANVARLEIDNVVVLAADGTALPFAPNSFDRVLVDAPCSGLGVLRRRPDARWRISPSDIDELAALQGRLLDAAVPLVRPGGMLVYSVCTVSQAETIAVASAAGERHRELVPVPITDSRWSALSTGGRLLPQDQDTDGMAAFVWTV